MKRPAATLHVGISNLPSTPQECSVVCAAAGPRLLMDAGRLLRDPAPRVRRPARALVNTLFVIALPVLLLPVLGPVAYEMGL